MKLVRLKKENYKKALKLSFLDIFIKVLIRKNNDKMINLSIKEAGKYI